MILNRHIIYYTPGKQSWGGGGVYRNHPVRLSVRPSVCLSVRLFTSCPGHNFLTPCPIWIIFHTIIFHDPRMCHDLDPRSYLQGQGSQCTHTQNPCPGHNSSLICWIWIIFHTIVVHDPRVCHDLHPRSYLQGQGHSAHIPKFRVRAITPHCHVGSG